MAEPDEAGAADPAEPVDAQPDGQDAGRAPSWEEVAEGYGDAIYTMAYRLTGNAEEAADLSQDVFVRVLRSLHTYRPGTFEGWLYRITKNLFLDRMRRRKRVRFEPLADEEWRHPVSSEPGPADLIDRSTFEARLDRALASLPPHYRLAVVLCDVEGLTYDEVAATTGWPLGTVRSRIHRGRRQLRQLLESGADAPADETAEQAADAGGPDPADAADAGPVAHTRGGGGHA